MNGLLKYIGVGLLLAIALANASRGADGSETIAIEFTADWCPYCRKIEPTVAKLIDEGLNVRQVDIDLPAGKVAGSKKSGKELATVYGVQTIPAMFVQTFDDSGKPGNVQRIPLDRPDAIRELLLKAGVKKVSD